MSAEARNQLQRYLSAAVAFAVVLLLVYSLANSGPETPPRNRQLIAFIADSLDVPFKRMEDLFERDHPDIDLILEPSGSVLAGRKVTLGRRCDILAVADHRVIDDLPPEYATWRIDFATNEIVIGGTQMSKHINEISAENWHEVLLRDDVLFGRADPDLDPCGYWTLLCWKLAEKHYGPSGTAEGLYEKLLAKLPPGGRYVREDSHKLMSLVEGTGGIDYAFVYKSQAVDHGLRVVELPPEISLGNARFEELYQSVSVEVPGSDGKTRAIAGKTILYALTVLEGANDPKGARELVGFVLNGGQAMLRESGFPPISPPRLVPRPGVRPPDLGPLVEPSGIQQ